MYRQVSFEKILFKYNLKRMCCCHKADPLSRNSCSESLDKVTSSKGTVIELNSSKLKRHHRDAVRFQCSGVLPGCSRMTPLPHLSRLVASGSKFGE